MAVDHQLERDAVEQREPAEIVGVPALGERIAPAREVVVAEHRDGRVTRRGHELGGRGCESRGCAGGAHEIARDGDDVRLELLGPARAPAQQRQARGRSPRARRRCAGS